MNADEKIAANREKFVKKVIEKGDVNELRQLVQLIYDDFVFIKKQLELTQSDLDKKCRELENERD